MVWESNMDTQLGCNLNICLFAGNFIPHTFGSHFCGEDHSEDRQNGNQRGLSWYVFFLWKAFHHHAFSNSLSLFAPTRAVSPAAPGLAFFSVLLKWPIAIPHWMQSCLLTFTFQSPVMSFNCLKNSTTAVWHRPWKREKEIESDEDRKLIDWSID